ncbi:MAG TPA: AraC family transcriptional regulator ligand-binding domain-containing protein [Kofleriaceae bacterium]|nr:AraC family transcriptional regulator ligand-binding domain-containing protein [Kofleriaceae bacterium]
MRSRQTGVLFTFRLIPVVANQLARAGIDAAPLLEECGIPHAALRGEITAPLVRIQKFIDRTAKLLDAPVFGLDLVQAVAAGAYGVAEFLVRASPTVEAGMRVLSELSPLINPIGEFRFDTSDHGGELHYRVAAQRDSLGMHLNEYTLAFLTRNLGLLVGGNLALERVWFSHARGEHADVVAQQFGCEVRFRAADCGFAIAKSELGRVLRSADQPLFEFLYAQARAQLAALGPIDIVSHVVRVIEARLPHGDVAAPAVAAAMATTVRSLQRHLGEAGTTYRDVLAHVRRRRRVELEHGGVLDSEIARQLGFADARSMRRSLDED